MLGIAPINRRLLRGRGDSQDARWEKLQVFTREDSKAHDRRRTIDLRSQMKVVGASYDGRNRIGGIDILINMLWYGYFGLKLSR